jgi:hypothetical protein
MAFSPKEKSITLAFVLSSQNPEAVTLFMDDPLPVLLVQRLNSEQILFFSYEF